MTGIARRRFGLAAAAASACVSLLLTVAAVELAVRWQERRAQSSAAQAARLHEAYQASAWREGLGDAGFLAPGFSGFVTNEYGRPVEWVHNSLGFRSREQVTRERPPGVLRILMLGDSFVAGHRLAQEQTVGFRLESWLRQHGHPGAQVLITAIEEPAVGLDYLESFGVQLQPQVVVLGITLGNDLAQTYASLDGEHCRSVLTGAQVGSGRQQIESNPSWDHLLQRDRARSLLVPDEYLEPPGAVPPPAPVDSAVSQGPWLGLHSLGLLRTALAERRARNAPQAVFSYWKAYQPPRLIDGNGIAMHLDPPPPEIERTYELLSQVLAAYQRVCEHHGIRFMVMLHAQRYQVQPRDLQATMQAYSVRPAQFDLMQPNRRIRAFCQQLGVVCLDPTEAMAASHARSGKQLFMPRGDMHWNADGAEAFFEATKNDLVRELDRQSSGA